MPKSKRSKLVSLTQTRKKGREGKESLIEELRRCVDEYLYIYLFSVSNMRNNFLKDVRTEWRTSRFFLGKNKVMAKALGNTAEDEYKEGLKDLTKQLTGNVGLLFTNSKPDIVQAYFDQYTQPSYARAGNEATDTIKLSEGPLTRGPDAEPVPHNMEPQLRKLGMPTVLKNGIVTLPFNYTVCREGEILSSNQANILKLFYHQLSEFKIHLQCYWHDGQVHEITDENDEESMN
ncbi:hypothetical protein BZG36_04373 [Bifiguratus adelaidae]|uniref:Ribosome assembly factor mrt4 n=1 Tax=Bifiguratus adelaidae TaxID=1938954 RepID=A0A261XW78_9FUNG|nr:hypothetical protein BZG36_04373 [Bifiguratus adelaidae]